MYIVYTHTDIRILVDARGIWETSIHIFFLFCFVSWVVPHLNRMSICGLHNGIKIQITANRKSLEMLIKSIFLIRHQRWGQQRHTIVKSIDLNAFIMCVMCMYWVKVDRLYSQNRSRIVHCFFLFFSACQYAYTMCTFVFLGHRCIWCILEQ